MTPQHQGMVDGVLQVVAQRAVELITCLDYPLGKNPPQQITVDQLRTGPLGTDLATVVNFVEGYQIDAQAVNEAIYRLYRILFGYTIQTGYRLPKNWQKTPFGLLVGQAYRKIIPQKEVVLQKIREEFKGCEASHPLASRWPHRTVRR